jgi:hypothetical protein
VNGDIVPRILDLGTFMCKDEPQFTINSVPISKSHGQFYIDHSKLLGKPQKTPKCFTTLFSSIMIVQSF